MELESINKSLALEEKSEDTYEFPNFYFSLPDSRFYFKKINLETGTINYIISPFQNAKKLFFNALTGLEIPKDKPSDLSFLRYDIVYKPEQIIPKFDGTLEEFVNKNNLEKYSYFTLFENIFKKYYSVKVTEIPEKIKQYLSFILFLNKEGLIYIFDYKYEVISEKMREKLWVIFSDFCKKNDKIGLVPENNMNIKSDNLYYIKKMGENEYFGCQ